MGCQNEGQKCQEHLLQSMYFFPIKIDFVLFGKNLHKILRVCTDLHTNCLYLCVGKISYTSCITNGILASILYWIQYSNIFLYFFSYKIVSLQEKISSNNKMSHQKGSSCNILRFPNGSLFSLYVERYTTESWSLIRKILLFRQYKKLPLLSNIDFLL